MRENPFSRKNRTMFRSFVSSVITLLAVLVFAFGLLFFWSGSENVEFKRVAMEGDRPTATVLEEYRRKHAQATEVASNEDMKEEAPKPVATASGDGLPVVLWISIPGFRGDYIEKSETPFMDELIESGGGTNKMRPNFPCLTFPAHATLATGTPPATHGIIADRIRKGEGDVVENPTDSALLEAEPIWTTATRQGIKTIVHDWPLSQNQSGDNPAAYFLDSFDPEATDEARLSKALETWKSSVSGDSPVEDKDKVRLVMLRLTDVQKAGLVHGPRGDDTYTAVAATDSALKKFVDSVQAEWQTLAPADANLVIFITTDHGMAELEKNVNIGHLLGDEMMANADVVAHDAIANLYFKNLPESEGEKKLFTEKFDGELSKRIYFRTYKKEELPEDFKYNSERVGDRVLVLKTGYAFVDDKAEEPVFDPTAGPGYFGGFGYPVGESIRMSGQVIISGIPKSPVSNLEEITGQEGFHATVCKILGIEPAEGASTETIPVD